MVAGWYVGVGCAPTGYELVRLPPVSAQALSAGRVSAES